MWWHFHRIYIKRFIFEIEFIKTLNWILISIDIISYLFSNILRIHLTINIIYNKQITIMIMICLLHLAHIPGCRSDGRCSCTGWSWCDGPPYSAWSPWSWTVRWGGQGTQTTSQHPADDSGNQSIDMYKNQNTTKISQQRRRRKSLFIDWLDSVLRRIAIFQPYNGGDLNSNWEDLCRNRTDVTSPPAAALFSTVVNGLVIQNVAGPLSLQVLQHKFRQIHTEKENCVNFAL